MAEIKIEKKKPVWPWILLILIIIAGVYIYWSYIDNMKTEENDTEIITDTIQEENYNYNEIPVDTTTMEMDTTTVQ